MRYSVKNLGPIKEASIDVRPMTLLVGPNNAGKTWMMNLWASIASSYNHAAVLDELLEGDGNKGPYQEVLGFARNLVDKGTASIDLVECAPDLLRAYFRDLCRLAPARFAKYMAARREGFGAVRVAIDLTDDLKTTMERMQGAEIRADVVGSRKDGSLLVRKAKGEGVCAGLMTRGAADTMAPALVERLVVGAILEVIHRLIVNDAIPFPTERALPFWLWQPLPSLRDHLSESEGDEDGTGEARWPLPRALLHVLTLAATPPPRKSQCADLATVLENKVLGGKIATEETAQGIEHLFAVPRSRKRLGLAISSSMVKELAPIVYYLRCYAERGDMLCIDEPEMNLHPEAQVKLTEFLGILVNSGLNVMATTHSSYLVDHLANLVKASRHEKPEDIAGMFFLSDPRAFLKRQKVGVYLFEGGTATPIIDDDGDIDWGTFANVSDRISSIYYNL